MPLLRKFLLRLTILVLFLVALYCYQTSNGGHWIVPNLRMRNASLANLTTTLIVANYSIEIAQNNYLSSTSALPHNWTDYYNVWCIFTKVASNSPMRRKFQIFVDSLLRLTSVNIAFHVISDDESQNIAQIVIRDVMVNTGKFMKVFIFCFINVIYLSCIKYDDIQTNNILFIIILYYRTNLNLYLQGVS